MGNYSSAFVSLFFWTILMLLSIYILYKIIKCICPILLNLEEPQPEDIIFEPEPVEDVQMSENIAGQEVVINGFID